MFIDNHVHLRDWEERQKETVKHGLEVARDSGVVLVGDIGNTKPGVTSYEAVERRLALARDADVKEVFYGLYPVLTANPAQVRDVVRACRAFTPHVLGLKLFAAQSTQNMGVVSFDQQRLVYSALSAEGYDGLLVVHAEEESVMRPNLWDPSRPITHAYSRPESSEMHSIGQQIRLANAAGFKGKLHFTHVSSARGVEFISVMKKIGRRVTCDATPHHLFYDWEMMDQPVEGLKYKMNPPLRSPETRKMLFSHLKAGNIDFIVTDHAPHLLSEKLGTPYCSGIPGLPWWPLFTEYLRMSEFSEGQIDKLTFSNARDLLGLDVKKSTRQLVDRSSDYPFNPYESLEKLVGWRS